MSQDLIARASTTIAAPVSMVWDALVNPSKIKQYMFGTDVLTDWKKGSPIVWKGEWKGKPYEDKGEIVRIDSGKVLQYTHYSPLTGEADRLENYHRVTVELIPEGSSTRVSLAQDHNATEEARQHSEENWNAMLQSMKKLVESNA